jgi:hypothetical protein
MLSRSKLFLSFFVFVFLSVFLSVCEGLCLVCILYLFLSLALPYISLFLSVILHFRHLLSSKQIFQPVIFFLTFFLSLCFYLTYVERQHKSLWKALKGPILFPVVACLRPWCSFLFLLLSFCSCFFSISLSFSITPIDCLTLYLTFFLSLFLRLFRSLSFSLT